MQTDNDAKLVKMVWENDQKPEFVFFWGQKWLKLDLWGLYSAQI